MGTKQIDEDGLLDLIRTLPTPGKTAGKKTTPAAASKKTKAKSKSKSPAPGPGPAKPSSVKSHDPQPATPTSSRLTSTKSFYGSAPSTSPSVPKPSSGKCNGQLLCFTRIQLKSISVYTMFFIPCRTPEFALGRQISTSLN